MTLASWLLVCIVSSASFSPSSFISGLLSDFRQSFLPFAGQLLLPSHHFLGEYCLDCRQCPRPVSCKTSAELLAPDLSVTGVPGSLCEAPGAVCISSPAPHVLGTLRMWTDTCRGNADGQAAGRVLSSDAERVDSNLAVLLISHVIGGKLLVFSEPQFLSL